jgi:hypothetical protein
MTAARALLEGDRSGSIAAVNRVLSSDFSDPEGLFYLTRHLSHLDEVDGALAAFRRVVSGGYFCYPAMAEDEWLDALRRKDEFTELLDVARAGHQKAKTVFDGFDGSRLLGG